MKWIIYRSDGPPTTSDTCSIWDVPAFDVQVIVVIDRDTGWRTVAKNDYYIWDDRGDGLTWWGVDLFGLWDYLGRPGMKKVLFGRTIAHDKFNELFARAMNETQFPEKTAYSLNERQPNG